MLMFRREFTHIWLIFVLLFAQGSAFAHSVSHFTSRAPIQSQHDKQLPHSPVCDKCVVYAELGGVILANAVVFAPPKFDAVTLRSASPIYFVSPAYRHYAPRAPPFLA